MQTIQLPEHAFKHFKIYPKRYELESNINTYLLSPSLGLKTGSITSSIQLYLRCCVNLDVVCFTSNSSLRSRFSIGVVTLVSIVSAQTIFELIVRGYVYSFDITFRSFTDIEYIHLNIHKFVTYYLISVSRNLFHYISFLLFLSFFLPRKVPFCKRASSTALFKVGEEGRYLGV